MSTHDDDTDPTGMRALLRGLPDPGPMPDDLVHRIQASLADLQPLDARTLDEAAEGRGGPSDVSRGTVPARPSWWTRHGSHVAVAAVVLIGGGVVAQVPFGNLGSGSDADSASSAGSAGDQAGTSSESAPDLVGPQNGIAPAAGLDSVLGSVVVRNSGRAYTAAGLSNQVGTPSSRPTTTPLTAEAPSIGPIGTEIGVRSCLAALGLPRASAAEVDLGSLDGTPTAIVVVTVNGERTAYAVGRDCTTGNPSVLAGPVALP